MNPSASDEVAIQRRYYADTAANYDSMHLGEDEEHRFALALMLGMVDYLGIRSILDIGSGTGRAIRAMKQARPQIHIVGIEPVAELRQVAIANGVAPDEIVDGDALALKYEDGAFDLVCEFGVLHHIKTPDLAVAEMLRVAKKGIFISDSNNFGQGSALNRGVKQLARSLGLWPLLDFVKTRGRGYTISEGDGLGYSYSVFNDYEQIRRKCASVHVMNTLAAGINPYRSATHVALLGLKAN